MMHSHLKLRTYVHTTHIIMHSHTHTHTHARTHAHTHTRTHTHTHTHMRTHMPWPCTPVYTGQHMPTHPCVCVCVSDHVAPPPVMNLVSTESGSDIRITWDPPGLENGEYFYRLSVSFRSTFSNVHPSRIEEDFFVHEFDRTGTNGIPFSSFLLINTSDDDNRQRVAASNTLMHRIRSSASYEISLVGVNRLLGVSSVSTMSTLTTSPTCK